MKKSPALLIVILIASQAHAFPGLRRGPSDAYSYACAMNIEQVAEKVVPGSGYLKTNFEGYAEAKFQVSHVLNGPEAAFIIGSDSLSFARLPESSGLGNAASIDKVDTNGQEFMLSFDHDGNGWKPHLSLTVSQSDSVQQISTEAETVGSYPVGSSISIKGNVQLKLQSTELISSTTTTVSCKRTK